MHRVDSIVGTAVMGLVFMLIVGGLISRNEHLEVQNGILREMLFETPRPVCEAPQPPAEQEQEDDDPPSGWDLGYEAGWEDAQENGGCLLPEPRDLEQICADLDFYGTIPDC